MTLHSVFTSGLCVPLLLPVPALLEAATRRRGREQLLDLGCLETGHLQPIRGDHQVTWPRTDQSQLTCRLPRLLRPLCLAAESPGSTDTGYPTTWRVDNIEYLHSTLLSIYIFDIFSMSSSDKGHFDQIYLYLVDAGSLARSNDWYKWIRQDNNDNNISPLRTFDFYIHLSTGNYSYFSWFIPSASLAYGYFPRRDKIFQFPFFRNILDSHPLRAIV